MDIKIEIPGNPGDARINGSRRATIVSTPSGPKPATRPGDAFKRWRNAARLIVRAAWRAAGQLRPIEGVVTLEVRAYWPRLRRTGPALGQPLGDVDAVAKSVLDVLQDAGVLGDDGQVRELVLVSEYDRERPRIEIRLGKHVEILRVREHLDTVLDAVADIAARTGVPRSVCGGGGLTDWLDLAVADLVQRAEARDSESR